MTSTIERPTTVRFDYVTPNDVFAGLTDGGSISVEEYPRGEITEAAKSAERSADGAGGSGSLVIALTADTVGGAPIDTVWFHPDQDNRLETITRARAALDAAEAALCAVGYVDKAFLR